MDFIERVQALSKKIPQVSASLATEEATKNALVMPFLHSVLGYDVFNPNEVIPEFTADIATKKGEKLNKFGACKLRIQATAIYTDFGLLTVVSPFDANRIIIF
ncbi:prophage Lp2 protein 6 [Vibrio parahaemolyticus AQ3810]|nr:prophage Lp2 protein 6 [Vibrio parahaemolyticus AQ3810]